MKNFLYKIANILIYSGVGVILMCVFILGDENGDGQVDNKPLMIAGGVLCFIGGMIRIYRNYNDR
ncbi:hypothetical protein [Corallibacter sp.]|uniref:hypothetical protein n=1 Tax=Corallibacter sp. TaxID=2038084 RepID=UPI003AB14FA3